MMRQQGRLPMIRRSLYFGVTLSALVAGAVQASPSIKQTNLVTDDQSVLTGLGFTPAATVDRSLINP